MSCLAPLSQGQGVALPETLGWNYFPFLSALSFSSSQPPCFLALAPWSMMGFSA